MPVTNAARTFGPEDSEAVVGIVQAMARELGDKFTEIIRALEPLPRVEAALIDLRKRMLSVETDGHRRDGRLDEHSAQLVEHHRRLTALEASKKKPRPRRKKQKRKVRR